MPNAATTEEAEMIGKSHDAVDPTTTNGAEDE